MRASRALSSWTTRRAAALRNPCAASFTPTISRPRGWALMYVSARKVQWPFDLPAVKGSLDLAASAAVEGEQLQRPQPRQARRIGPVVWPPVGREAMAGVVEM